MRIFITGASGFIGTAAVEHFLGRGWSVANFDRAAPKLASHQVFWIEGDIRDAASLAAAVVAFRPDYVLHLAAVTGAEATDLPPEYFDTNTLGVESLLSAIKAVGTVKRTIYVSSLLVCRNGYIPTGDEDYCPPGPYGVSKVVGEQIVRRAGAGEWVIVRPTGVWGPWFAYSYRKFFQLVSRGLYIHIAGAKDLVKPTAYVGNTVYMFEKLLTAGANAVASRTFYFADYPDVTVGEWADTVQRRAGARKIPTLPLWLVRVGAHAGDLLKRLGWRDAPLTSFRLRNLLTGGRYPLANTRDVVGELPYSLDRGVDETLAWMREYGWIRPSGSGK
jgi:nucleoside-diphosphate-sugar epimerase